jgi:cytochrome P450
MTDAPVRPAEAFDPGRDMLEWMAEQFGRHGDVFFAKAFGVDVCATNRPDHVQHVLRKNWRNYRKGFAIKRIAMLLGKGLMVSEGELWKTQRKLIQPAFHGAAIARIAGVVQDANERLLAAWADAARAGRGVNITHDISHLVLECVLLAIFGDDYERAAAAFAILSDEAARDLGFAQAFQPLRKVVAEIAERRRARGAIASDILGMLLAARDASGRPAMSDTQLVSEVITMVVAGHETTAITLGWVWFLLSQNPDVEARAHRELDGGGEAFASQVIEEAMRLYPPGWLMTRRAIADDWLGEHRIRAGTEIYIAPYFIQRSPALWTDPQRFDPDRFSPERAAGRPELAMLPFSAGPRNCIGEAFARMEMQIHVTTVARRLRLVGPRQAPPPLSAGVNLRSTADFIMAPQLRSPAALGSEPHGVAAA